MLIHNYGLFWKARDVHWGRSGTGNKGHLCGVEANNTTAEWVDFREQSGIYVLQSNFRVVYVGQAGYAYKKLFDRLKQHRKDHLAERWDTFSWFGTRAVIDQGLKAEKKKYTSDHSELLNHLEAILIATSEPALNLQSGKFGEKVEQYLQRRDSEALGPTSDEMIKDIWDYMHSDKA
jgi:hypothetical protein